MNTADILDKAADLIEERGWHQGWYCGPGGELCAAGAMFVAVGLEAGDEGRTETPQYLEVRRAMSAFEHEVERAHNFWGGFNWNDAPERTKEEVVSTLRAAAQAARAEQ